MKYGIENNPTKHVQESRIEGAPNSDVLGVILQEKVYIALGSSRQHEGSQVLFHLRRSATTSLANAANKRANIKPT